MVCYGLAMLERIPSLDANSGEPLYRQLGLWLRDEIAAGRLRVGDRLPATREFAERLGVNRQTVGSAYGLLENEGLVTGHVGKGSFVAAAPETPATGWVSLGVEPRPRFEPGEIHYHFDSSRPSEELFPVDEFRDAATQVLDSEDLTQILQLGSPHGLAPLRQYILESARREGAAGPDDDVLITSGCQQAMDLVQRLVTAEGDVRIAIEDPVYPGVKNVFGQGRAKLVAMPVGQNGVEMRGLKTLLERERPRLLVVTPSFQNPTGGTMPLEAREKLVAMAQDIGALVVENGIYANLRYDGAELPPVKALGGDRVLLLGSFSKLAFPGLRVGWVIGPRGVIARLAQIRHWCDLHSDQLSQAILLQFAASWRLAAHREEVLRHGRARLLAVLQACRKSLPPGTKFTHPEGGMNLWVEFQAGFDTAVALELAQRRGVTYLPGRVFAVERPADHCLRLSFAGMEPERIRMGVAALAEAIWKQPSEARRMLREPDTALV
jgi:2-aminoadipate transaminase